MTPTVHHIIQMGGEHTAQALAEATRMSQEETYAELARLEALGAIMVRTTRVGSYWHAAQHTAQDALREIRRQKKLRSNSLEAELREFFRRNPDEELRREDIRTKFDRTFTTVDDIVGLLLEEGYLAKTTRRRIAHYHLPRNEG